ncbi:MAG TPA: polysaccharide biosynthesis/export family protein [Bryobacteraceae bacterium]|nr:polysaccharide biosynthesis/export family protein [Bryobacteraceae bacterium]
MGDGAVIRISTRTAVWAAALFVLAAGIACPQDTGDAAGEPAISTGSGPSTVPPTAAADYVLGPGDQIALLIPDADELNTKAFRIDQKGDVSLPLIGRIQAAGLTAEQLESAINLSLQRFLVHPNAVVAITDYRSQPISVLGAVNAPGVHQVQGEKSLYEVLSLAGGLREDAGNTVRITRKLKWGPIPLPGAKVDPTGQFSIASLPVKDILQAANPAANIPVKPEDVISVPKAAVVYAIGAVHKPGGFTLGENASLSALQVLSLAEGLDSTASPASAKIMRVVAGRSARAEIPVNLRRILAGKSADLELKASDILFVPSSFTKSTALRTLETAIGMGGQIGAGLAIYK